MVIALLTFLLGLGVLLVSTQHLVRLAEKTSRILRISPLIVGITIVAIGTSLPELAVSTISIIENDPGLALGNIIGSNIVNILLVLPVGILIGRLRIGRTKTQRNALILLAVTTMFLLVQLTQFSSALIGFLLIVMALLISIIEYQLGLHGRHHEDMKLFKVPNKESLGIRAIFLGVLLIIGIIAGGILVVHSIETISLVTGISTTILGLTLTAVATSLPELLTTIYSQEDHQEKITVGNILGSNIYNLLLVGGIVFCFSSGMYVPLKDWIWLALTTIVFVGILKIYRGKRPPVWISVILFVLFLAYLFSQQKLGIFS